MEEANPEKKAVKKYDTRLQVLILRHPQEQDKELGTAPILVDRLSKAVLRTGLSWPNLKKALGDPNAESSRWGVLFLGTLKASAKEITASAKDSVVVINRHGYRVMGKELKALDGIVVLDGTWAQAKTMWWRNAWLLKLNRVILKPTAPSLYGLLRREPRKECLSSLEAVAEVLLALDNNKTVFDDLKDSFKVKLEEIRAAKKLARSPVRVTLRSPKAQGSDPCRPSTSPANN